MNLLDGTCYLEDFVKPYERLQPLDRLLDDLRRLEQRHQEMAEELTKHGWRVEPPGGR